MDFVTTVVGPVKITIDKVEHRVPRMLLPGMAEWMMDLMKAQCERATKDMSEDKRAQWLLYYAPPAFDVDDVAADIRTPDGVLRLLRRQLAKAEPPVPTEKIEALLENAPPDELRKLAGLIGSADQGAAIVRARTGGGGNAADPLAKPKRGSAASRSTGEKSTQTSQPPSTSPKKP